MIYAGFDNYADGRKWRNDHGGWLFVSDDKETVIWFDAAVFTPSKIMAHRATSGLCGSIDCWR